LPKRLRRQFQMPGPASPSPEIHQQQKAHGDEAAEDDAVPPLLRADAVDQAVDPGDLAGGAHDAPVHAGERLALQPEALVDGVGLREDRVGDAVAAVYARALVEHVVGLLLRGVALAVVVDVGADVGEQVGLLAGRGREGGEAGELVGVLGEDLVVPGQVVLLERRGGEVGGGVEEAG
jgi:hypothetical protein